MEAPPIKDLNEYSGTQLEIVGWIFVPICIFFVALRWYSRHLQRTPAGIDDYFIYPALVLTVVNNALNALIVPYGGVGHHTPYWVKNDPSVIILYEKMLYAVEMMYIVAVAASKLAILAVFLRVLIAKWQRYCTYMLGVIVSLAWIVGWIVASVQCVPFTYLWNKKQPGHCLNQLAFYRYLSIPNIVTDVFMLLLPLPVVWKLHTTMLQKVALTFVFLTGSIGLISSAIRFHIFLEHQALADPQWKSVDLLTWTVLEPSFYLISACLPTMRALFSKLVSSGNSLFSRYGAKTADSSQGANTHGTASQPKKDGDFERLNDKSSSVDGMTDNDGDVSVYYAQPKRESGGVELNDLERGHGARSPSLGGIKVTTGVTVSTSGN